MWRPRVTGPPFSGCSCLPAPWALPVPRPLTPSADDSALATLLFQEGRALIAQGRVPEACQKFAWAAGGYALAKALDAEDAAAANCTGVTLFYFGQGPSSRPGGAGSQARFVVSAAPGAAMTTIAGSL